MIKVTVELVSAIHPSRSRILGVAEISNDGQQTLFTDGDEGNYNYRLSKFAPRLNQDWRRGRISGFDRVKRGPWDLLYQILRDAVADRNRS